MSMKGSYDVKGDFISFGCRDLQSIIAIYKNRDSRDSQVGVGDKRGYGLGYSEIYIRCSNRETVLIY